MNCPASRILIECERAVGLPSGLPIVAVLQADDGITSRELADIVRVGADAAKRYVTTAARRRWLMTTDELRNGARVYRRTERGKLLTQRLSC
jgi:hypothetical protein